MESTTVVINGYVHICSMIFYSRDLGRQGRGRGNNTRGIWKHGKNKKIGLSIHFNVDLE